MRVIKGMGNFTVDTDKMFVSNQSKCSTNRIRRYHLRFSKTHLFLYERKETDR